MSGTNNAFVTKTVVVRRSSNAPVRVEIGNGAIAPKVALKRAAQPVKVETR